MFKNAVLTMLLASTLFTPKSNAAAIVVDANEVEAQIIFGGESSYNYTHCNETQAVAIVQKDVGVIYRFGEFDCVTPASQMLGEVTRVNRIILKARHENKDIQIGGITTRHILYGISLESFAVGMPVKAVRK